MAAVFQVRGRDGTILEDVASVALDKVLLRRLNRPAMCSFRIPSYLAAEIQADGRPLICAGWRQVSVSLDATGLYFHGPIWTCQDDGDEDMCYTNVICWDPMMLWRKRPARDDVDSFSGMAGNLSDPSFIVRNKFGGLIMEEILTASESPGRVPGLAEGPLWIDLAASTFTGGGADLSGAPTNWPMTIAEIATLLTNTGELDIIVEPMVETVSFPVTLSNMATITTAPGNHGVDRTGTVQFAYAAGDNNVRLLRRIEDMETMANKIFDFLGPRLDQQHWRSNVTGDHPLLSSIASWPALETEIDVSREGIGTMMQIGIYDNFGLEASAYPLYVRQWLVESLLRVYPRTLVHITPTADDPNGYGVGDFDIGDLVSVETGAASRVTQSGVQRVYGLRIDIDNDAVERLGELVTSPDQDSI